MRALVIDDSRTVRLIIGQILRELRIEVIEAGSGLQGLEQVKRNPDVQLMLVDFNMPEMNGLEFIRAVRAQPAFAAVPILMVTTEAQREQVNLALEAGATEYLMKPFNKDVLLTKLQLLNVLGE